MFICLRLALVNSYIKRGVRLPLILDDVLVNCDSSRAKHGVTMLRDFAAQGTQVFFFTCHSHLAGYFESAGADVRELELRDNVVAPDIPRFAIAITPHRDEIVADAQSSRETDEEENVVVGDTEGDSGIDETSDVQSLSERNEDEQNGVMHDVLTDEEPSSHLNTIEDTNGILTEEHVTEAVCDDELLSTEQEIAVVDRLVEAVAGEMDQIEPRVVAKSVTNDPDPAIMDIGDLVERAIEESRNKDHEEEYDEIEIIEEDDDEMNTIEGDDPDAELVDWQGEVWDADDIEDEDDLAA